METPFLVASFLVMSRVGVLPAIFVVAGIFVETCLGDQMRHGELADFALQSNDTLCAEPDGCTDQNDSPLPLATLLAFCLPVAVVIVILCMVVNCCMWRKGLLCCPERGRTDRELEELEPNGKTTTDTEPEEHFEVHQQPVSDDDNDDDDDDDLEYAYAFSHELRPPADSQPGSTHTYSNVNNDAMMSGMARRWKPAVQEPGIGQDDTPKNGKDDVDDDDEHDYVDPTESDDDLDYEYAYGYQLRVPDDRKTGAAHSNSTTDQRNTLANSCDEEQITTVEHDYFGPQDIPNSPGHPGLRPLGSPHAEQGGQIQHSYAELEIQPNKSSAPQHQGYVYEVVDLQT